MLSHYNTTTFRDTQAWEKGFENFVRKGENAGYQLFLQVPPCFLTWEMNWNFIFWVREKEKLLVTSNFSFSTVFPNLLEKFSRWVENNMGKEEIACYEQFLLFHIFFKRHALQTPKNHGLFGKGLKAFAGDKNFINVTKKP